MASIFSSNIESYKQVFCLVSHGRSIDLSETVTGNSRPELKHQNNAYQTTTTQVEAKSRSEELHGCDVFFSIGSKLKLELEVPEFGWGRKRKELLARR